MRCRKVNLDHLFTYPTNIFEVLLLNTEDIKSLLMTELADGCISETQRDHDHPQSDRGILWVLSLCRGATPYPTRDDKDNFQEEQIPNYI